MEKTRLLKCYPSKSLLLSNTLSCSSEEIVDQDPGKRALKIVESALFPLDLIHGSVEVNAFVSSIETEIYILVRECRV